MFDEFAGENFDLLSRDRGSVVAADDGVPLAVREVGPEYAPLTVVFVHGFCNRMTGWHLQRVHLEEVWGPTIRMVFFDLRGHGNSGVPRRETCTIPHLARDIDAVIRALVPEGPIVLVGHSMGGMAVLSYVGRYPDLIGSRVVGVGLIATAAGALGDVGLARTLNTPVVAGFSTAARALPRVVQGGRGASKRVLAPILRSASFGDRRVSPAIVWHSEQMINDTPLKTLVDFLPSFKNHDETAAVPLLEPVPTLVLCGDRDLLTPFRYSKAIAEQLPEAELVRVPGAGHMVHLERASLVSEALDRLVTRSVESLPAPSAWRDAVLLVTEHPWVDTARRRVAAWERVFRQRVSRSPR
ncbi:alpha/beta hydrolase [Rhodococcus oxybenzonivorans]|uniref:Alpha/beta hydrolase n=1 Tax=Rhodococcus oxybenzonivorans TaxID=1990687 RepID=A0A2S2BX16_9NOCA|nr:MULTISPECIES: alpha/beta hydrolase [Rhodococcus]AWK73058.1 alpha/beta hydrolase [Rhodococcus oxybenzonivorans]QTJ69296.1 alpha/beta hydrolase [Rhodococcus sp. ZPP]